MRKYAIATGIAYSGQKVGDNGSTRGSVIAASPSHALVVVNKDQDQLQSDTAEFVLPS